MSFAEFDITIEAEGSKHEYWKDFWRFRELVYFLAWRDILVRYKQAFFGVAWAVFRPALTTFTFAFVFGKIARLSSGDIAYPLFVLGGMLPWQLVTTSLATAGESLIGNAPMISKVYFPRMVIPMSSIIVCWVDFLIGMILLAGMFIAYGAVPGPELLALPLILVLCLALGMGGGLWLSALTVRYRDFRYAVPFLIQFSLYISPVGFGSETLPPGTRALILINPLAGPIEGFRWALFGIRSDNLVISLGTSTVVAALLVFTGIRYFRKVEKNFADII